MRRNSLRLAVAWTLATLGAGLFAAVPATHAASGGAAAPGIEARSLLGSYLAGRIARNRYDTSVAASYYRFALRRDPGNHLLLEPTFLMETSDGNWDEAVALGRRLLRRQKSHRVANLLVGLADFKAGDYAGAEERFKAAGGTPIGQLTGTLARGWVKLASGNPRLGLKLLSLLTRAEGGKFHVNYHTALIADQSGRTKTARAAFKKLFGADQRSLRLALAYARHAAHASNRALARKTLESYVTASGGTGHELAKVLEKEVDAGKKVDLLVKTPHDGLAEVFYGLGEALIGVGAVSDGAIYLQLSLYAKPAFEFPLEALANVYEATKKYDKAIATYDRVPSGSPLQFGIAIRKAMNLNQLDRPDEAKDLLDALVAQRPADIRPLASLGNIMRARKRFGEAVDYYSKAIALLPGIEKKHWAYFYWRGTSYERLKKWPEAEKDLEQALKLNPSQPQVLNYLGYSWIDQNRNLKKGLSLIEKAVRLKPDDGYIVDSLGWAHFRLGNFADAVKHLERAVELRPEDPVLNDHLGDALWQIGRKVEAKFQWNQSLTLKPEPDDAVRTRAKLAGGLPTAMQTKAEQTAAPAADDKASRQVRRTVPPPPIR